MWYHLYNFKNVKNTNGGVLLLLQMQAFTKSNTPLWVFLRFLNCSDGNKSRNASHMFICSTSSRDETFHQGERIFYLINTISPHEKSNFDSEVELIELLGKSFLLLKTNTLGHSNNEQRPKNTELARMAVTMLMPAIKAILGLRKIYKLQ